MGQAAIVGSRDELPGCCNWLNRDVRSDAPIPRKQQTEVLSKFICTAAEPRFEKPPVIFLREGIRHSRYVVANSPHDYSLLIGV
jgi:hypothetical protein